MDQARLLQTGGVLGVTPGTYLDIAASNIVTVDTAGDSPVTTIEMTGSLNEPRWYGTASRCPTACSP